MTVVYAIGLMSGTSCDGMSGVLVELAGSRPRLRVIASRLWPYPARFRGLLLRIASGTPVPAGILAKARAGIARAGARVAGELLRLGRVSRGRIACIGSHGQTLFHAPHGTLPTTLQVDDPSWIAEATGITTVGDFRSRDVAAGGEGAPLAPWAHWVLYRHPREPRLILNLGGIANVTWLPAGAPAGAVRAFDTGPANMLLDSLAGRTRYDAGGRLAARGRVHGPTLRRLLGHPYFRRRPPKSTGREMFGAAVLGTFRGLPRADALATATEFTARSVAGQVDRWLPDAAARAAVYVGGGGVHNRELMRRLAIALAPRPIAPLDRLGVRAGDVEPACFALLAWARLRGLANTLPAVTGARRAVCAGLICPA